MQSQPIETIAQNINDAGYSGLFLHGENNLADSIWQHGENRIYLEQIVQNNDYSDLTRILASEVLYAKLLGYPPEEWHGILAYLYSQALAITGGGSQISGNQWGFLYHTDEMEVKDYGPLGTHLVEIGVAAVPYLAELLDNSELIFYEGSEEATVGNSLAYRVKDAAAYYISKITGIPVAFHEQTTDRDAEIERLKETLKNNNQE